MQIGTGTPVLDRYERICFDKSFCNVQGKPQADLIAPGHPLLDATIDLVRERNADVLKRGAVLIDDNDYSSEARLLFYVEDSVQDGIILPSGSKRVVSKNLHFVELKEDGSAANAGYAPYLDYRAATEDEQSVIRSFLEGQRWLTENVEDTATSYAISEIVPAHVSEVRQRTVKRVDKTVKAVKDRLTAEIQFWDFRAGELKTKEAAGKVNAKLNSDMATRRADDLQARMQKRLAELEQEKHISALPPVIVGGAVVIPRGLLDKLMGRSALFGTDAAARRRIELAAMKAVMDIERSLDFTPTDVSAQNRGYDIESKIPAELRDADGTALRFIEVKGRAKGATSVTVTKNEILTALNEPEQYILAVVEVDGDAAHVVYLKKPFHKRPDFAATSVNYDIADLIGGAEIIRDSWQ